MIETGFDSERLPLGRQQPRVSGDVVPNGILQLSMLDPLPQPMNDRQLGFHGFGNVQRVEHLRFRQQAQQNALIHGLNAGNVFDQTLQTPSLPGGEKCARQIEKLLIRHASMCKRPFAVSAVDAGGYVIAGIDKAVGCRQTFLENNVNTSIDYSTPRYLDLDIFPATLSYPHGQQAALFEALETLIPYYRARAPRAPLLFAICAPCQPFTRLSRKELSARRKAGRERDSNLLREAAKFVKRFKPELVLSENVQGIRDPKYGGIWDEFRGALEALGFLTGTKVICTSRFGIPQVRRRSILLAARRELVKSERLADLLGSEMLVPEADPDAVMVTVRQAIDHLPPIGPGEVHPDIPNHRSRSLSALNQQRIAAAVPGDSNAYMEHTASGDLSLECHRKVNGASRSGASRMFTPVWLRTGRHRRSPRSAIASRMAGLATTIRASCGEYRCGKRRSCSHFLKTMFFIHPIRSSR
jgi:DNA (cytosine-5)-methyltransferase 1